MSKPRRHHSRFRQAALAVLILLAGGAVVGYVVYKREEAADVRGSSTQEFDLGIQVLLKVQGC